MNVMPSWWNRRAHEWRALGEATLRAVKAPAAARAAHLVMLGAAAKRAKDVAFPVEGESAAFWSSVLLNGARTYAAAPSDLQARVAPAVEGVALVCLSLIDAEHAAACRRQLQRVTGERDDD